MTNEILAVKLCELDRRVGRMHGRILNLEHAPQEVLQQEIEALRREYQENKQILQNNLRFSRAPSVAELCQAYTEVEKVLERLREQMGEESRENKAAQSGGQKETSALVDIDPQKRSRRRWKSNASPQKGGLYDERSKKPQKTTDLLLRDRGSGHFLI